MYKDIVDRGEKTKNNYYDSNWKSSGVSMHFYEPAGKCEYSEVHKELLHLNLPTALKHLEEEVTKLYASATEEKFNELAKKWKRETGLYSFTYDKINDTYLDIIANGKEFLPFILRDVQKAEGSAHWHPALKAITGTNPVPIEEMTKNKKIKERWIAWAKENKII
jgi:hypothetical protein